MTAVNRLSFRGDSGSELVQLWKRCIVIILFITLTPACTVIYPRNEEALIGSWTLEYEGQGPYHFSQIAFTNSGLKCVITFEFDRNGNPEVTYWLNKFWVEDGVLVTLVTKSSTPHLPAGYIIHDRIEKLLPDYFEVFMIKPKGRIVEKHHRLDGVEPEQVCEVVRNYFAQQNRREYKAIHSDR